LAISIIAVSIVHRGEGIGRNLVEKAKTLAFENGIQKLPVATQAANESAMKFYAKIDFSVRSREYIYHLHFPKAGFK
jgi:ribosomal protein S18 acetylase RimI-like enzyme